MNLRLMRAIRDPGGVRILLAPAFPLVGRAAVPGRMAGYWTGAAGPGVSASTVRRYWR
ncbi:MULTISPECIES: hypothetical protein [Nonomuraea]|uniref:Uncharacterized protein n=1 Tax=Nonomuraea mangrovi TaxID=2316207 RepID=A0ABW4SX25_9ACTN